MVIQKILVKNYKLLKDIVINLNPEINIFVGENDSGKSTILEVLSILTSGRLHGLPFERQLKANLFNRETREKYIADINAGSETEPPRIVLEAYFSDDSEFKGTENELGEDSPGLRVVVDIAESNLIKYKLMLENSEIKDIPVELYGISYNYFSGADVHFRSSPFKSVFIDTTQKAYAGLIDNFVSDSISNNLSEEEKTSLAIAYKTSRRQFHDHEVVKKLNEDVKAGNILKNKSVSLDLLEENVDAWKRQLSVVVNDIPFEHIGFGTQNIIKIELALRNADEQANIVLMEEPENNLAFSNMTHLVNHILKSVGKQVFISTHSSYIANKLDLGNVILVENGDVHAYNKLPDDTKNYFKKLPGYDTLRFVLASKVILVEGATDDLLIQRAYKDKHGHYPAEDGIDIISVESLAFKRFADIAILMKKDIDIVTDNDGNIEKNINQKYKDYIELDNLHFFFEADEKLNTIETSVLSVNCKNNQPTESFKNIISKNGSLLFRDYDGILEFMKKNKTEWALRVVESEGTINYPKYIQDVIEKSR